MSIDPAPFESESGEAHPHLERDSCFLRQDRHRAGLRGGCEQPMKRLYDLGFATGKVIFQLHIAAGMRLIPVRETSTAAWADP